MIKLAILLAMLLDITMAKNPPSGNADVVGRNLSSIDFVPSWFHLGHAALYDVNGADNYKILQVRTKYPAIHRSAVRSITHVSHYWGARYGIGSNSQHYNVIAAGVAQQAYRPQYRYTPNYTEGGWGYSWKWSWSKFRWYKNYHMKRARFRCDSFVVYCYKKGTGKRLTSTWRTTPHNVLHALPNQR